VFSVECLVLRLLKYLGRFGCMDSVFVSGKWKFGVWSLEFGVWSLELGVGGCGFCDSLCISVNICER
jgi:hypothetical protein